MSKAQRNQRQGRGNNQLASGLAKAKTANIGGKNITRFPIYLKNRQTGMVEVARDFNAATAIASSGGQWDNIGIAPVDISRALLQTDAPVQIEFQRTYALYKILDIDHSTITLWPEGKLEVTKTWIERFKPAVGSWVVRTGHLNKNSSDSYQPMNDKVFNHVHGQFLSPEQRDALAQVEKDFNAALQELAAADADSDTALAREVEAHDGEQPKDEAQADNHRRGMTVPVACVDESPFTETDEKAPEVEAHDGEYDMAAEEGGGI